MMIDTTLILKNKFLLAKILVFLLIICPMLIFSLNDNFCYVSNQMGKYPNSKYLYQYPSIYFNNSYFGHEEQYNICDQRSYNISLHRPTKYFNCTLNHYCPIKKENIETAMFPQQWNAQYQGFKNLIEILNNKQDNNSSMKHNKIRIVVIGGSSTVGHGVNCGCYCNGDIDKTCIGNNKSSTTTSCDVHLCSWSWYFIQWFSNTFPTIKFDYINLAEPSYTSKSQAISITSFELNENDFVLIDESVNDASSNDPNDIEQGLELLLRRLYSFANYKKPTIIILEEFLFPQVNLRNTKYIYNNKDYATVYRRLSQYYGTILISLRDVYWSYFNLTLHNTEANNYINKLSISEENLIYTNYQISNPIYPLNPLLHNNVHHPPWYVHLYMADILSACFMKILNDIEKLITNTTANSYNKSLNTSDIERLLYIEHLKDSIGINEKNITNKSLLIPSPLFHIKNIMQKVCNKDFSSIINLQSNSDFKPSDTIEYEGVSGVKDNTGWREYIDYHEMSGWIINSYSHSSNNNNFNNKLSFYFQDVSYNLWKKGSKTDLKTYFENDILNIGYLQSYEGMGKVDVYICGMYITTLDGLNVNYHFSVPIVSSFHMNSTIIQHCMRLTEQSNKLQTKIVISNSNNKINYKTVDFIYHPINKDILIRINRKFKLLSVHLCMPERGYSTERIKP